ncbi:GrpB family protein [Vibrio sp. S4M6]|uniref:GrpB family protein n=1 Tax=Vibrio sinus TaxID=2946865 RepID=UPI002029C160|nr:GrpB family protein [Vibrio sinus]MCL9783614.1 GrpB family protein [Vibrio sinus]
MSLRVVEVIEHNDEWQRNFNQEKSLLSGVLEASNVAQIHHIGSTSVEGLCAKPIIDILLEVHSLEELDANTKEMESLGYEAKGEFGIEGRRYFQKSAEKRTHQVHAFLLDSRQAKRHLAFRDYLRAFPDIASEYGRIKKEAAAMCQNDIEVYMDYKDGFIKEHEAKALEWIKYQKA